MFQWFASQRYIDFYIKTRIIAYVSNLKEKPNKCFKPEV